MPGLAAVGAGTTPRPPGVKNRPWSGPGRRAELPDRSCGLGWRKAATASHSLALSSCSPGFCHAFYWLNPTSEARARSPTSTAQRDQPPGGREGRKVHLEGQLLSKVAQPEFFVLCPICAYLTRKAIREISCLK